jgi:LPS-assembly lipoprotein
MWSFEPTLRGIALALLLAGTTTLAACSGFSPVYGERAAGIERQSFRYDKPATRLEQIIYQELVLRVGRSQDQQSPMVRVTATQSARALTRSNVARPSDQREMVVEALIEIVDANGAVVYSARRSAAALYTTDSQVLSTRAAETEAAERAARELAETVRLTLLGALAGPAAG